MKGPAFLITIDTEGDDIWARPETITTENARFLPRFQRLCGEFGFKPTYLVNYEMAIDPRFQALGRQVLRENSGEIGLHVHPWNSPPLDPAAPDPRRHHVYLTELSDQLMGEKVRYQTALLRETFETPLKSHRAGRWGFDERVARVLVESGYVVDCSVTPGVSWRRHKGLPEGGGGPDYFGFPERPYFIDPADVRRPGPSPLLELPMTIRPNHPRAIRRLHHALQERRPGKWIRKALGAPASWLRPNGRNLDSMISVVDWAIGRGSPFVEFMLHSSEFMPGGSPIFRTSEHIETLYEHLRRLFTHLASRGAVGQTLAEFHAGWARPRQAETT
jgi:hypothetical protein